MDIAFGTRAKDSQAAGYLAAVHLVEVITFVVILEHGGLGERF